MFLQVAYREVPPGKGQKNESTEMTSAQIKGEASKVAFCMMKLFIVEFHTAHINKCLKCIFTIIEFVRKYTKIQMPSLFLSVSQFNVCICFNVTKLCDK